MAIVELKVPSPGESITEVVIARWVKNTGDIVEKDEVLAEVDSDKATLTLNAEESGNRSNCKVYPRLDAWRSIFRDDILLNPNIQNPAR